MIVAVVVLVLLLVALLEARGRGLRADDLEDAGWLLTHWVLVPSALAVVALPEAASWWRGCAFLLVWDLLMYAVHRGLHASRWGWAVHRLHHSSRELGTLATWRQTVLERVGLSLCAVCAALVVAPSAVQVAGVMMFALVVEVAAHRRAGGGRSVRWLGLVCADVHHAHHWTGARWNYGHVLLIWDRVFGTYLLPDQGERRECGEEDRPARLMRDVGVANEVGGVRAEVP